MENNQTIAAYIFMYNIIYIKADFTRMKSLANTKFILLGSDYCLKHLSVKNKSCFEAIHQIGRDFHNVDHDEIERIVLHYIKLYGAEKIRLLTNEDSAQITCAKLRELYNIPGYSMDSMLPFVNKVISKNKLDNVVRIPKFIQFDKEAYLKDKDTYLSSIISKIGGFPMFAKPIDLVSSVETHFVPDLNALYKIAKRISQHDYNFEIDEFIDGDLFHCDAMIIDGDVKFFMSGRCSFALARFFEGKPVGSIPVKEEKLFNDLKEFCITIFKKLNCPNGAYHLEAFLDRSNQELVFLEVGARTGGALISRVYDKLFKINIEEINYLIQMRLINNFDVAQPEVFAGFLNFPTIKGKVLSLEPPILDIDSEFIEFVEPGETMHQAQNLLDMSCSIIFWDKSYDKVETTFEFLKNYEPLKLATKQKKNYTLKSSNTNKLSRQPKKIFEHEHHIRGNVKT